MRQIHTLDVHPHRKVHRLDVLGQRPHRYIVNARFGNAAQCDLVDAARGFQFGAAGAEADGGAHVFKAELIEHDDVGAGIQCLTQFIQILHFHFDRFAGGYLMRGCNGLRDPAAGGDVVFLDQKGVVKTDAVVVTAAAGHGVFLGQAQAGDGFAGVEQFDRCVGHQVGIALAVGGNGGERLQEVQGAAFTAEQGACGTFQAEQTLIGANLIAIADLPDDFGRRIELAKHFIDPCGAADDGVVAGDHGRAGQTVGGDQLGGDVAAAYVFVEGDPHILLNFAGQFGKGEIGHAGLRAMDRAIIRLSWTACGADAENLRHGRGSLSGGSVMQCMDGAVSAWWLVGCFYNEIADIF